MKHFSLIRDRDESKAILEQYDEKIVWLHD